MRSLRRMSPLLLALAFTAPANAGDAFADTLSLGVGASTVEGDTMDVFRLPGLALGGQAFGSTSERDEERGSKTGPTLPLYIGDNCDYAPEAPST